MNNLEFKSFKIENKAKDTNGNLVISGYAATFGNVDSYNDIIEAGAFANTLKERKGRIAFCYQHDIWNPVGKIQKLTEDKTGLAIEVMLSAANEDLQTKIEEDILKELSIGYRVVNSRTETRAGIEVRMLEEVELYEVSLVTIAANPLAVIENMKSEEKHDFLEKEFDRLIAIIRNEPINFELRKLKSLVFSKVETHEEKDMTAQEIFNLLTK